MKIVKILFFFGLWITLLAVPLVVLAEYYELPEPLVGQAQVTNSDGSSNKHWFGIAGNEAVLNYDPYVLLGFNEDWLKNQCNGATDLGTIPFCFQKDISWNPAIEIMNSRTSIDDVPGLEIAALFWPDKILYGDIYTTTGSDLDNFALLGRNLNKSRGDTGIAGGTWEASSYTFNPEAQSSYSPSQKEYYTDRIKNLRTESEIVPLTNLNPTTGKWYLQAKTAAVFNNISNAAASNPEGKVWQSNGPLTLTISIKYQGKGTLIVNGDLVIRSGVSICPTDGCSANSGAEDKNVLGIIVTGDVTLKGKNRIKAPIFARNITIEGDNVTLIGSYTAENFVVNSDRMNVRFLYDFHLESGWPPGFRWFNMPTAKNSAP